MCCLVDFNATACDATRLLSAVSRGSGELLRVHLLTTLSSRTSNTRLFAFQCRLSLQVVDTPTLIQA